jgi:ParB family chromosome partitioning protein
MSAEDPKKRQLGRGLSALFGDQAGEPASAAAQAAAAGGRSLRMIPVAQIRPSRVQPRRHFAPEHLEELSKSIREQGVLQPILVRRDPDHPGDYELIAGERRWRAAQAAQIHEVPAVIQDMSGATLLEAALVENIQRQDLNPIEEAEAFRRLVEQFGLTQEAVAEKVGKSRSAVANTLRLLDLPEEIKHLIDAGTLTAGHARAILMAPEPLSFAARVAAEGLTVRQAEELASALRNPPGAVQNGARKRDPRRRDADTIELERRLASELGLKVEIKHPPGKQAGSLTFSYKTLDQLDAVLVRLGMK